MMHKAIQAVLENKQRLRPFADAHRARVSPATADSLAQLERRFDGPIPAPLREAALAGGAEALARRRARADLKVYLGLIRDTVEGLRALRRAGTPIAAGRPERERALLAQLAWYRERRRQPLRRLLQRPAPAGASGGTLELALADRDGDEA